MIIAIIAGGSGTRLWPLSQANYPKHLLKLTGKNSLLQSTYQRSHEVTNTIYVVTESSHADEVRAQLPDLPPGHVIVEPGRRGTASCILLALATIKSREPGDEPIAFLHADHHISDTEAFAKTVKTAAENSKEHGSITMIGIEPTYPATGFGYIQVGKQLNGNDPMKIYRVDSFKEKPDLPTAKSYIKNGNYLWNLGLFAAPEPVFAESFERYAPDLAESYKNIQGSLGDVERLREVYLGLPSQPIDTALIEKTKDLEVVGGTFDWADIGSFFDLHKILQDKDRNSLKGDVELIDCEDVMIHGGDKPVVAIGLSGIVVVDSPEGLLVCSKEQSQLVGEAAKKLQKRDSGKE